MSEGSRYDPTWAAEYFDGLGEKEWARLVADPVEEVNLHMHIRFLRRFIEPRSRVLETGPGPGRFTRELAALDCAVVVTDISRTQLELHRQRAIEHRFDHAVEDRRLLDITDMAEVEDDGFDAVLCYGGPLAYVFDQALPALRDCHRIVKRGGRVLASVPSLWGTCHARLESVLDVPPAANRRITDSGDLHPDTWADAQHRCHMYRSDELKRLFEEAGFEVEAIAASGVLSVGWSEMLAEHRDDDAAWGELLRMEEEVGALDGCRDLGTYLLAAGRAR